MILMYHHVGPTVKGGNWVSAEKFDRDLKAIAAAGKRVVPLARYASPAEQVVLTFDDGNRDILEFAAPRMAGLGFPFELFLVGRRFGQGGGERGNWLSERDVAAVRGCGGRLQYHSWTHADLTLVADDALEAEIGPPESLAALDPEGFEFFAYPFCRYDERILRLVRKRYRGAVSGKGLGRENEAYAMDRVKVTEDRMLFQHDRKSV
ncbi:MAG: polysaccharide deacetylase family protein [Planctomycetota bacterium]|jgi:hypothetical protein|nr:polysaccharide deacetylase family protein [Planctomycetota bacterium]